MKLIKLASESQSSLVHRLVVILLLCAVGSSFYCLCAPSITLADNHQDIENAILEPQGKATETEPNDGFNSASGFRLGDVVRGTLGDNNDLDYYKFSVPQDGLVTISFASDKYFKSGNGYHDAAYLLVNLYDGNFNGFYNDLRGTYALIDVESKSTSPASFSKRLSKGEYYIRVFSDLCSVDFSNQPYHLTANLSAQMFRLYNRNSGEHFYTSNPNERNATKAAGWKDEGVGWIAPLTGDPVYRLYNEHGGEHHYTTSANERDTLKASGWKDEGIGWRTASSDGRPLFRQYNPNAFANNHNYTTSSHERDTLLDLGWNNEGIAWYGLW